MPTSLWYVRDRSRITGPFDHAQLDALRRRGQLSRFHQVSQDRVHWVNATILADLFAPAVPAVAGDASPLVGPSAPALASAWYYAAGKEPSGPITTADLLGLLRTGAVTGDTSVWKEGLPNWVPLHETGLTGVARASDGAAVNKAPRPLARRRRIVLATAAALVAAGGGGVGAFFAFGDRRTARQLVPHAAPARRPIVIRSVVDGPQLTEAIGLVVCGVVVTEFDGTQTEVPATTGTCFAVSNTGHLLTNRHVIEDVSKLFHAEKMLEDLAVKKNLKVEPRVWVFLGRHRFPATILYKSDDFDLAVLKIEPKDPMPRFRLAARDDLARGTPVFALGFPGASRVPLSREEEVEKIVRDAKKGVRVDHHFQKSNFDYVVTDGIVSVVRREGKAVMIEHTARVSGGNSGGPLVTSDGTVIGVNTLVAKEDALAVPTFVALEVSQLRDELSRELPEITDGE